MEYVKKRKTKIFCYKAASENEIEKYSGVTEQLAFTLANKNN